MLFTIFLYVFVIFTLLLSFAKDKERTLNVLKRAGKTINNIMPQCIMVLMLVVPFLSIIDKKIILEIMGKDSGILGILFSGVFGAIAYIPAMIAFPLSLQLLNLGAGYSQITMFATTLSMVGVATLPMELKYYGKKLCLKRNIYGFIYAFILSYIISFIFK